MAGVLLTDDYDDFDMSKLIVKTPIPHNEYYKAVKEMYSIAFHPKFIARQLWFAHLRKKDWQFLFTYGVRAVRRVRQHVFNLTQASTLALRITVVKKYWIFIEHLPATSVLAVICWIQDQALSSILTIFFFGWLIDADHVFDYLSWAIKNKQPFVIKDFVKGRQFTESLKVSLPLHSWEIAGALFLLWLFQKHASALYFFGQHWLSQPILFRIS